MLQTRMTVPFSEAVARRVPVELMERKEMGALCAWIRERVEKRSTSPDCCCVDVGGGCVELCAARGEVGEGTGDGYAR